MSKTKTELTDELARETYHGLYIAESVSVNKCAEILDVAPKLLRERWQGMNLRLRTRSEAQRAAKQPPGQLWVWPPAEANPAGEPTEGEEIADPLEAVPALDAIGDGVAFKIQDGRVFDVRHEPAEPPETGKETPAAAGVEESNDLTDARPGLRAIEAGEFDQLLSKVKGNGQPPNGRAPHIVMVADLRLEDDTYFHPIIGDIDRLFGRLCARGIPAHKAVKAALKAAELARMGVEPAKIG